jgi:hypothetical protein
MIYGRLWRLGSCGISEAVENIEVAESTKVIKTMGNTEVVEAIRGNGALRGYGSSREHETTIASRLLSLRRLLELLRL